jgi:hypothetical protein
MKEFVLALLIVFVIGSIIFAPLAFIWSLNTLFPVLNIPFIFKTWVAALFLLSLLGGGLATKINK